MDNELMRYTGGGQAVPFKDRRVAKEAKLAYDQVRLDGFKADGAIALGAHLAKGLMGFRRTCQSLSTGDPGDDLLLGEIFGTTVRQCQVIQAGLFSNNWGL